MTTFARVFSLLIWGDVEPNPGPTDQELLVKISSNDETVLKRTNGLKKWLKSLIAMVTSSEDRVKAQVDALENHVQTREQKICDLENGERENNLIIYELKKTTKENPSSLNDSVLKEMFENKLGVSLCFPPTFRAFLHSSEILTGVSPWPT